MKRINYKSDFNFILRLLDCRGDEVGFPDYDWVARFWTGVKANAYEVSCIGGVCKNCYNDDGTIHVVFDNHHLSPGVLRVEFVAMLPDGIYPDGDERVAVPAPLDVELVRTAAPCPSSFEVEVILPYIKFRYEDLTDEQKAELMQPAVDAANHAKAVLKDAEAATAEAVRSNRELAANVEAAAEAETQRQRAEEARVSNEESRQRAETLREDAEAKRKSAETTRVDTEAVRVTSENARVAAEADRAKAETTRVTAENARVSAESKRVEQEDSRKEAEGLRTTDEAKRVDAEAKRVTAENARKTAEQGRVTAENGRISAEEARVEAERERAAEFESWQTELDGKADRTELTEGLATKQGNLSTTTDLQLTNDNVLGLSKEFKDSKLDKSVWDEKNEQFCGENGVYITNAQFLPHSGYILSEYIPLNKTFDISINVDMGNTTDKYAIIFFDYNRKFVSGVLIPVGTSDLTVAKEDFPNAASFFRVCTRVLAKQNSYYSNGPTFESREGAFSEAIAASKLALFIDLWNSACGTFGKYDPQNAPDPEHPFYLNELWLTYEEAVAVYEAGAIDSPWVVLRYYGMAIRTNLPPRCASWAPGSSTDLRFRVHSVVSASDIEVLNLATRQNDFSIQPEPATSVNVASFAGPRLRRIIGAINCKRYTGEGSHWLFGSCPMLEDVSILELNANLNLSGCPRINAASLAYLVNRRYTRDGIAITVTLHPDVFAKLTDEANADWHQVLLDAAEKNIIFATT